MAKPESRANKFKLVCGSLGLVVPTSCLTRLLTATLLLAIPVFAQSVAPWNGTTWKSTPGGMRDAYVLGYIHGTMRALEDLRGLVNVALRDRPQLTDPRSSLTRANGLTPSSGEIRDAVDEFYSVPENLPVCMASAVNIEWLSLTGHPYEKSLLEAVRKVDGRNGCNTLPTLAQYAEQVAADAKAEAEKRLPNKP